MDLRSCQALWRCPSFFVSLYSHKIEAPALTQAQAQRFARGASDSAVEESWLLRLVYIMFQVYSIGFRVSGCGVRIDGQGLVPCSENQLLRLLEHVPPVRQAVEGLQTQ